jgi:hypothetical protein
MTSHRALVEYVARVLPSEEREPALGDMMEANESAWSALSGIAGLVFRRQAENWKNWRPWLAGFGVALPNSFLLMGVSLSVSWSYQRLLCPELLAQASLTKPSAIVVLLWQALLLIGAAWTGGFVVGSVSKRTLWASTLLCYSPCLICLSRYQADSLSRYCLFLFLLPAIWGVYRGLQAPKVKLSLALIVALALSGMILSWNDQHLLWQNAPHALVNWALSIPAWYLVFAAWKRRHQTHAQHAA